MYSCSSESDEGCINWDQPLSINCYLLERWVVKDVSRAPIIHQDPVGVVVPYPYVNYKCIVVWVVEMPGIFLYEPNDGVVDSCHLWDGAHQLDVLNHL